MYSRGGKLWSDRQRGAASIHQSHVYTASCWNVVISAFLRYSTVLAKHFLKRPCYIRKANLTDSVAKKFNSLQFCFTSWKPYLVFLFDTILHWNPLTPIRVRTQTAWLIWQGSNPRPFCVIASRSWYCFAQLGRINIYSYNNKKRLVRENLSTFIRGSKLTAKFFVIVKSFGGIM